MDLLQVLASAIAVEQKPARDLFIRRSFIHSFVDGVACAIGRNGNRTNESFKIAIHREELVVDK